MILNILNIFNLIEIEILIRTIILPEIMKISTNGIAFICNMDNVLDIFKINNYCYMLENDENKIILESKLIPINKKIYFKVLIDNYILEDYLIFNNLQNNWDNNWKRANNWNKENIYYFIKKIFLPLEEILISNQKIFFDYKDYLSNLIGWWFNFKILINKSIINSNIIEDIYYNISLELLLDVQSECSKSFIYFWKDEYTKLHNIYTIHDRKLFKTKFIADFETYLNIYNEKFILDHNSNSGYLSTRFQLHKSIQIFKNYFKIFKENPYKIKLDLIHLYKEYPKSTLLTYGLDYDINILTNKKYIISNWTKNFLNTKGNINISKVIDIQGYNNSMMIWKPKMDERILWPDIFNVEKTEYLPRNIRKWIPSSWRIDGFRRKYIPFYTGLVYDNLILDKFKHSGSHEILQSPENNGDILINGQSYNQNTIYSLNSIDYDILGGYSYLWAWHQDAVDYHGEKGPGGAPLWDDYIKWKRAKMRVRYTLFSPEFMANKKQYAPLPWYNAKFIKKLKHGARIYNIYSGRIYRKWGFSFDQAMPKRKFLKYILHGRRALDVQKVFLHNFIISDDLWGSLVDSKVNNNNKLFRRLVGSVVPQEVIDEIFFKNQPIRYFRVHMNKKWMGDKNYEFIFALPKPNKKLSILSDSYVTYAFNLMMGVIEKIHLQRVKNWHDNSINGLRGPWMKEYAINFWSRKNNILTPNYLLNNNKITWDTFYTNIENVTDSSLTLNYINKNFYGKHLDKEIETFLVGKFDLKTNTNIPKNTNILIKKAYIENLIYVYHKEEEPMINYIQYKRIKSCEDIWIFLDKVYDTLQFSFFSMVKGYKTALEVILTKLSHQIWEMRQIRSIILNVIKGYNIWKEYHKYLWVVFFILIYIVISSLILLLIKSFLPKNIIYGIKTKDKIKVLKQVGNMLEPINNKNVLKKDFFDVEHKFVYRWDNRFDKLNFEDFRENRNNIATKKNYNWQKEVVYNKYEKKKKEDVNKNYVIFYKTFLFDKNLEKWENNTKFRASFLLWGTFLKRYKRRKLSLWTWSYKSSFLNFNIWKFWLTKMWKGWGLLFRDKKWNYNRKLIWKDPTVDEDSKIIYYHLIPKLFFNFFFIIRFARRALELWELKFWIKRWTQLVKYGVYSRLTYADVKKDLNKEWSLEWYKDNLDFGPAILYKDYSKIITQFKNIRITPENKKVIDNNKKRQSLIIKILQLTLEKNKLKGILKFQDLIGDIKTDRHILSDFDSKFENIKNKLIVEVDKISPKESAKQDLMLKYIDDVEKLKEAVEQEEFDILQQNYTRRLQRDADDDHNTLEVLEEDHWRKVKFLQQRKLETIKYEKKLRIENHKNFIVDKALDTKEQVFYESIKEYNEELSALWLKIEKKENLEKLKWSEYESISRKMYSDLEQHYIWYRYFTTMGARLNYVLSLIISIFTIWSEHVQKIRKNDNSLEGIFLLISGDLSKYIYKIYWEYIIIWKKYKTFTKLGYNIIDILKFSLILTPLAIYASSLYLLLLFYVIFKIDIIINKNNKLIKYFIKLKIILNILFSNLDKNYSNLDKIYIKFYQFCGWIQRNIYYIKGAFKLGYKEKGIKEGIIKIYILFLLKYKAYIEKKKYLYKKKKDKKKEKRNWKNIIKNIINKKKDSIFLKIGLLRAVVNIEAIFIENNKKFANFLYDFVILDLFKIDRKTFYIIYNKNINLIKIYLDLLMGYLNDLITVISVLKFYEILWLFFKWFLKLLFLPITFIINHQKLKYVKNYKKGIFGFINNPMYLIIDNPKNKNNWKLKLHIILMEKKISNILYLQKTQENFAIELLLLYKIKEIKIKNKNIYQEYFWKGLYWEFNEWKHWFYDWIIPIVQYIETSYAAFEDSLGTRNLSLWAKCKYTYNIYKLNKQKNNLENRLNQKRISRDIFFYKKAKDRKKIVRIYFFKGIINWLTYITINKIFFKNTKVLKKQELKVNNLLKYKLTDIDEREHLGYIFSSIPPQFWALFILYERLYKNLLRYNFESKTRYPIHWEDGLEKSPLYKWRLASPAPLYLTRVPFYDRSLIAIDYEAYNTKQLATSLASTPYDPILRWALFLLEFNFGEEEFNTLGTNVWADISMTHLLTYNSTLDQYQYEVRDFNRLLKGTSLFRIAENSLEKDKAKHYKERYELIKKNILLKNEDVLIHVLKQRREKVAKLLEKALSYYKLVTPKEQEEIDREEQSRDYFYVRKKEFFEELGLSEYLEWQAEWDAKEPEEKYYGTYDINKVKRNTDMLNNSQKMYGKPRTLEYLIDTIAVASLDQTLEEINYFLKFDIWKILEKKEKNKIRNINYKHVNIKPSLLNRINANEHIKYYDAKLVYGEELSKINDTKINWRNKDDIYYAEKYYPLEWKQAKNDPLYNMLENNAIYIYIYTGNYFSYQDKIKNNEDATAFVKPEELFHGHPVILQWYYRLKNRRLNLKNLKKKSLKKIKLNAFTLVFINNIRWSWEQWLGYGDTEKEDYIFNKNIVILNEKYRLWNIKRAPIRLKMPVILKFNNKDVIKEYFAEWFLVDNWAREEKWFDLATQNHFLMTSQITPLVKDAVNWLVWKRKLESRYNKTIAELILWIFKTTDRDRQVAAIKKEYYYVLDNFLDNYNVFNKLYFLGMTNYTWDLIRYHELFLGDDEITFDGYYRLKQIEFIRHDPAVAKVVDKLHTIAIDRFKPGSYVLFHIYQHKRSLYYIYSIIPWISFFWVLKVIFYNPGQYIADQYILWWPILLGLGAWYLKKYVKNAGELIEGKEIYLYKYHSTKVLSEEESFFLEQKRIKKEKAWIDLYFDSDKKKEEVFGLKTPMINPMKNPEWWRYPTHLTKDNMFYTHLVLRKFMIAVTGWWLVEWWRTNRFKYRNLKIFWDYYPIDPRILKDVTYPETLTSYRHKHFIYDSYDRLEGGGNLYSRWYENHYRLNQNKKFLELDYGFDFQIIKDFDVPLFYHKVLVHMPGSYSDALWVDFCRTLSIYIPDVIRNSKNRRDLESILNQKIKRKVKFKDDYKEHLLYDFRYESEANKYTEWSSDYNVNVIEWLIWKFKRVIKNGAIEWFLGIERTKKYHPLQAFFEFQKDMLRIYNYDLTNNLLTTFLIESKMRTQKLIITDFSRYFGYNKTGHLKIYDIFEINDFVNEVKDLKINSFNTGSDLNIKALISISEKEKHLYMFYQNLLNYKIKRLDLLLEAEHYQLMEMDPRASIILRDLHSPEKNKIIAHNYIADVNAYNARITNVISDRLETIQYLKLCENYLLKIFKKITYDEKIEYKYNLLINTWRQNNWSWSVIHEIFINKTNFFEILDILLKIIINIFN